MIVKGNLIKKQKRKFVQNVIRNKATFNSLQFDSIRSVKLRAGDCPTVKVCK